jgi:ABC-type bacteriocin/lantibiotic exporter with double-glycine peptidase domain
LKTKRLVGAGGFWQVLDQKFDESVVKQKTPLSCVSAVGEMLLNLRGIQLSQDFICDKIGEPASVEMLSYLLNEVEKTTDWYGGFVTAKVATLAKKGSFGAVLREGTPLGHLVLVRGLTEDNLLEISDSFDQTSYKMTESEFLKHWGGEVIFKWK